MINCKELSVYIFWISLNRYEFHQDYSNVQISTKDNAEIIKNHCETTDY